MQKHACERPLKRSKIRTAAPPASENELLGNARAIAGLTLQELARRFQCPVPRNLRRNKGWVGELIEIALGASAGSLPEPDFRSIGVELKTLPIRRDGRPKESTHICTVPLTHNIGLRWENSLVRRKLCRVLWIPIEADPSIPLAKRHIGSPLLWSPSRQEEAALRTDWEELMDMVSLGELDRVSAYYGECLQIRPKAADGRALTDGFSETGAPMRTLPRGFYLRASFTEQLLGRYYARPR